MGVAFDVDPGGELVARVDVTLAPWRESRAVAGRRRIQPLALMVGEVASAAMIGVAAGAVVRMQVWALVLHADPRAGGQLLLRHPSRCAPDCRGSPGSCRTWRFRSR
ncbi:MAG: hypothetical protein R2734_14620 [Nocardioides sp.]